MSQHGSPPRTAGNASAPQPTLLRRVGNMALAWLLLAVLVGACSMPPGSGVLGIVAGMIAGVIVLLPFGLVLGLLGGRWNETLIGGAFGLVVGTAAGLLGAGTNGLAASTGLVAGALVGATLPPLLRHVTAGAAMVLRLGLTEDRRASILYPRSGMRP